MKKLTIIISFFTISSIAFSQSESINMKNYWQIGVGFGEIPFMSKSFKPSITVGYYLHDKIYVGAIYQFVDNIERNQESFDAQSIGFEGLESSKERVAQRALLHCRITPVKYGPFISFGLVFNGSDTETMQFDDRNRQIGQNMYDGEITVKLTRKSAFRPAIGLGYEYVFKNNISLNTEWTFNVFHPIPSPVIEATSDYSISENDSVEFNNHLSKEFKSNFHNRYHIFQIGVAYNF